MDGKWKESLQIKPNLHVFKYNSSNDSWVFHFFLLSNHFPRNGAKYGNLNYNNKHSTI